MKLCELSEKVNQTLQKNMTLLSLELLKCVNC